VKKITIIIFAVLTALTPISIIAQPGHAILSGNVNIIWEREVKLDNHSIPLSEHGDFKYRLFLDHPNCYTLSHQNKRVELFISPGDSLNINLNAQKVDITGANSKLNMSLQEHEKIIFDNGIYLDENNEAVFSLGLTQFISKIDSLKTIETKSLNEVIKLNDGVHPTLKSKLSSDIVYRNKRYKLLYPHNYNRHTARMPPVKPDYFDIISEGTFNHPELLSSSAFVRYVNFYLDIQAAGQYKFRNLNNSPVEKINSRYQAIVNLPVDQKVKDFFLNQHFVKAINEYSAKDLKGTFTLFEKDCKDDSLKQQIRRLYHKSAEIRKLPDEIRVYKRIGNVELDAHIFHPKTLSINNKHAAYLFFHGGSWAIGAPEWGYNNCQRFALEGMVAISFEYRLRDVHGTYVADAVSDAFSAISWVRENAKELEIDTEKIVAAGFSSGAHLAACTAMIDGSDFFGNNQKFSSKPNALILQSAAYSIDKRGSDSPKVPFELLSPMNNIKSKMVPVLMFHGEFDDIVPFDEFELFIDKMKQADNDFTYTTFKGGHFFYGPESNKIVDEMSDEFLASHGFLNE
jgi:acetyl esterase/lipase